MKLSDLVSVNEEINNFLYHSTSYETALKILKNNNINGLTIHQTGVDKIIRGVSLTRDLNFAKSWDDCIFVLDKEALISKFKLLPYNAFKSAKKYRSESEEFLIGNLSNLSKYLNKIYIKSSVTTDEIKLLTNVNIVAY